MRNEESVTRTEVDHEHFAVFLQNADSSHDGCVCRVEHAGLVAVEVGRREAVPLRVAPVHCLLQRQTAFATRMNRLAQLRKFVSLVHDLMRVPPRQRSHVDDLERYGVGPTRLGLNAFSGRARSFAIGLDLNGWYLRVGRLGHEDVLVLEGAVLEVAGHRVACRITEDAMVVSRV